MDNIEYGEKPQLERICEIGNYVRKIKTFTKKYTSIMNENNKVCYYRRGFCDGIEEIMESYYKELVYLENVNYKRLKIYLFRNLKPRHLLIHFY